MARLQATLWNKYKFFLSGLVLILPIVFLYQSLNPVFPDALPEVTIGDYTIIPMPYDLGPAYQHDGVYVKDFLLTFTAGDINNIRQAYLNIGNEAAIILEIQKSTGGEGFLHGSQHGQHVHAIAKPKITAKDSIWLTIENWNGEILTTRWEIPQVMLN
ncbi:MAG: hypothetical protein ACI9OH_002724 [Oleispira sp.]|jgi:hypothetical protein